MVAAASAATMARPLAPSHGGAADGAASSRKPSTTGTANAKKARTRVTGQGYRRRCGGPSPLIVPSDAVWSYLRVPWAGNPANRPCYTPASFSAAGLGPRTRRSTIARARRIGRPVRRPSDRPTTIRRDAGGATGEVYPGPTPAGAGPLLFWGGRRRGRLPASPVAS